MKSLKIALVLVVSAMLASASGATTVVSPTANAQIQMSLPEQASLVVSGSSTITVDPNTGVGNEITLLASWAVGPGHSTATVYGWFSSPTAALSDGSGLSGQNLPSSQFSTDTVGETPCTQTYEEAPGAVPGAGCFAQVLTQNPGTDVEDSNISVPVQLLMTTQSGVDHGTAYTGILTFELVIV